MKNSEINILSADWVLPVTGEAIENGAVALCGDKIVEVGLRSDLIGRFEGVSEKSFGQAAIIPGLINCHSHLELTVMRGFLDDIEHEFFDWLLRIAKTRGETLDDSEIIDSARLGALEGVRGGVTCFGDIGRLGQAGFSALKEFGLRGVVFQETEFSPDDAQSADAFKRLIDNFDVLKDSENGLVKAGLSPHAPYTVSASLFGRIASFAVSSKVPVSIHTAESAIEEDLMQHGRGAMAEFYTGRGIHWQAPGKSSVRYLADLGVLEAKPLLAHCVWVSDEDLDLIKSSGSSVAHCPKSNAKFGHRAAPFETFLDQNLRVGLGSDSVASNNTCDLFEEGRNAALTARTRENKKRLVTAREILQTMTIGGARTMQIETLTGSLEPGKQADLAVVTLSNPAQQPVSDIYASVVFASGARDVIATYVAGKAVYEDGRSVLADDERILRKALEIGKKLRDARN